MGTRPVITFAVLSLLGVTAARAGDSLPGTTPRSASRIHEADAEAPYPWSDRILDVTWDFDGLLTDAGGSDLWQLTWSDDDQVYATWGDGWGFPLGIEVKVSYGFAEIAGMPPDYGGTDISGFESPDDYGKITGLVSIDGVFYMTFNKQDGGYNVGMAYSTDRGVTFHECPTNMWPESGMFFPGPILNYGKDYAGARDGYVYLYGTHWVPVSGGADRVYMARMPVPSLPEDVCDIARFEYLGGPDDDLDGHFDGGTPTWSSRVEDRVAVFHDPNGVPNGMANVVYSEPLRRYILTLAHRPPGEPLMAGVGQLGIFEGKEPWGPWKTVAYYDNWGGFGFSEALGYVIGSKWITAGGRGFWMIFSADYELDRFNMIKGVFTLPRVPDEFLVTMELEGRIEE